MAYGLSGRVDQLQTRLSPDLRYTDIAVCFVVCQQDQVSGARWRTGEESPVYGGRWDWWTGDWAGDAYEENVVYLECSVEQLRFIESNSMILEGSGGRGGGKSEGGALKVIKQIVTRPYERGRILSPTFDLADEVKDKILGKVPPGWLLEGSAGYQTTKRQLRFVNGHELQWRSTERPRSLRSWGGSYCLMDEGQDMTTEAVDIAWFCLRNAPGNPQMFFALTPKGGEALERHDIYADPDNTDAECQRFNSYTNVFTSKVVFDYAKRRMDKDRYEIEAEASWEKVRELEVEEIKRAFRGFDPSVYSVNWASMYTDIERKRQDVTKEYTRQRLRMQLGRQYIIGIDPNWNWPNYAVVLKVLRPVPHRLDAPGCHWSRCRNPVRWIAVDVVSSKGNCEHLGKALKAAGYNGRNSHLVPDASARYNHGARSSVLLLRSCGFKSMSVRQKNPDVRQSIDDVSAKLFPAAEDMEPCMFFDEENCQELLSSIEAAEMADDGRHFKKTGDEHIIDALRYPVSYFDPAARDFGAKVRRKAT
jgi:hypothetical protein